MSHSVKPTRDKASLTQLNLLLAKADLKFVDACKIAGIKSTARQNAAYMAFYRGSKRGDAFRLREKILTTLNRFIRDKHSDEVTPL